MARKEKVRGNKKTQDHGAWEWKMELEGWKGVGVDGRAERSVFPSPTSPPTVAMDAQKQLQALSEEFQQLQTGESLALLPFRFVDAQI